MGQREGTQTKALRHSERQLGPLLRLSDPLPRGASPLSQLGTDGRLSRCLPEDRAGRGRGSGRETSKCPTARPRQAGGATTLYRRQRKTAIPGRGATGATAETKERRGCSASNRCAGNKRCGRFCQTKPIRAALSKRTLSLPT